MPENQLTSARWYIVYSDRATAPASYLEYANTIVDNGDGTYSAKRIDLDPSVETYLPIEVEAENFTCSKVCTEGEVVSIVFPVDMPISNINGTVYLFEGAKIDDYNHQYFAFNSDLDLDVIPAHSPIVVKAKAGNILKAALENVHVYPMTGCQSITIGDATHYVSYQQESAPAYSNDNKVLFYRWNTANQQTETPQHSTTDDVAQFNSFFAIENTSNSVNALQVRFSDPTATLTAVPGVLNSICPEHDGYLTAAEGKTLSIYVFAGIHDGFVYGIPATEEYRTREGYVIAGVPYIFVTDGESVTFNRTFTDYDYERETLYGTYNATYRASQHNNLQGVLKGDGAQLKGHDYIVFTKNGLKYAPTGQYTEGEKEGQDKTVTVGRGKCFIYMPRNFGVPSMLGLRVATFSGDEGNTTDMEEILKEKDDENAPMYNLWGRPVGKDYKGIIIQNGKKYIQK